MICIIDYGIGNIGSVSNMFKKLGIGVRIVSSPVDVDSNVTKIILPGVGHFDACMKAFREAGFEKVLYQKAMVEKVPLLGICVGYQMLTESSEEGQLPGLGWIPARTIKFVSTNGEYKIPHMGWNAIKPNLDNNLARTFADGLGDECRAYFVHSYYVSTQQTDLIMFEAHYINSFAAGMAQNNIYGVQFHPEKSHKYGLKLFKSFAEL